MSYFIDDDSLDQAAQEVFGFVYFNEEPVAVKFEYSLNVLKQTIRVVSCMEIGRDTELVGLFIFSNDMFAGVEAEIEALVESMDEDDGSSSPSYGYNGSAVQ